MTEHQRKFPRFHAITNRTLQRALVRDLHTLMPQLIAVAEGGNNPLLWLLNITPQSLEFRAMLIDLSEAVGGDVWPKLTPKLGPSARTLAAARTLRAIDRELVTLLKGWPK